MTLFRVGAVLGFFAVAFGAFGTHSLKGRLSEDMLAVWQTGTHYQLIHAVVICVCGLVYHLYESKQANLAGWLFTTGVLIFSGSLYALALSGIRVLGAITPLGGLAMLAGWFVCAVYTPQIMRSTIK